MNIMKLNLTTIVSLLSMCCMACSDNVVTVKYNGQLVEVSDVEDSDSLIIKTEGTKVCIENIATQRATTIRLAGQSDNGQFVLKTRTKDRIELDGVRLQSAEGAPIWIKNKKKVAVLALNGTENTLTVTACKDTAHLKSAVIYAKDKLLLSGKGKLSCLATGDGCKGINAKDDITIESLTLDVKTTGNNLGKDDSRSFGFGDPMGPPPGFGPGGPDFNFDDLPEDVKKHIEEMKEQFENGEFPMGPPPPGMGGHGPGGPMGGPGMMMAGPPEGEGPEEIEGGGFKQKYIYTCKGIKSNGQITINSGNVNIYTTSAGAEGLEGKDGVIINGGEVAINSADDAINANAAIYFNGGKTTAISRHNDAVDANPEGGFMFTPFFGGEGGEQEKQKREPLIFINGGEVCAYSWVGAPEEGFDCDFNPIEVTGGTAFSIGAGMGEMPSVPTAETAHQPTALIIGFTVKKGQPVILRDKTGKTLFTTPAPFSFNNSSSLITCPDLKVGGSYTIECGEYKKEFEMKEMFSVVR